MGTPKTPGGISVHLLTPCRRLGLTRKRHGNSPILPENSPTAIQDSPISSIKAKPKSRLVQRKLVKPEIRDSQEDIKSDCENEAPLNGITTLERSDHNKIKDICENGVLDNDTVKLSNQHITAVATTSKTKAIETSGEMLQVKTPIMSNSQQIKTCLHASGHNILPNVDVKLPKKTKSKNKISLTKQCMIVIENELLDKKQAPKSDSDSDNEALINLLQTNCSENKEAFTKRMNLENKHTVENKKRKLANPSKIEDERYKIISSGTTSQTSQSQDSDEDFDSRKTILVRKSYPKDSVTYIKKSKSTGSVTQKDIDDIKHQIKMKQNELLIKSKGHNIIELECLIKKWRKGCQEALMELLQLMRKKVPLKDNMEIPDLLNMLNIPSDLVHYDMLEDCFD